MLYYIYVGCVACKTPPSHNTFSDTDPCCSNECLLICYSKSPTTSTPSTTKMKSASETTKLKRHLNTAGSICYYLPILCLEYLTHNLWCRSGNVSRWKVTLGQTHKDCEKTTHFKLSIMQVYVAKWKSVHFNLIGQWCPPALT